MIDEGPATPAWTLTRDRVDVRALANVSTRIRQVTRGSIATVLDKAALLATIIGMNIDNLDPGLE